MLSENTQFNVTVIPGDGIGPEVVGAAQRVLAAASVPINWEVCEAGAAVFKKGLKTGVPQETIDSINRTQVVLKGPLETPLGYGEKSANVTLRKMFETFANVRPVRELPGVITPYSGRGLDLVVIRENVEDLYAGIEHMQTPGVAQCLKLISRKGSEKLIRFAFEYARAYGRPKVTCATKSNIMKLTEGLVQRVFEEVAPEYPEIEARHMLIDNAAHQLVIRPEQFEVLVTTNMNGDIISDLTSGLVGGLGVAPSANIGHDIAIFEAVHGSAPDIAGQGLANPTALILTTVHLLRHLGLFQQANMVANAVLVAIANPRTRTRDLGGQGNTETFTNAVIESLGMLSPERHPRQYRKIHVPPAAPELDVVRPTVRREVGVDIFIDSGVHPHQLGPALEALAEGTPLTLKMISNRGTRVYPPADGHTDMTDHHRCRFMGREGAVVDDAAVLALLGRIGATYRWCHVEKLPEFDGEAGFTHAQGEE